MTYLLLNVIEAFVLIQVKAFFHRNLIQYLYMMIFICLI